MTLGATLVTSMDTESAKVAVFSSIVPPSEIDAKSVLLLVVLVAMSLPNYLGGRCMVNGTFMATASISEKAE